MNAGNVLRRDLVRRLSHLLSTTTTDANLNLQSSVSSLQSPVSNPNIPTSHLHLRSIASQRVHHVEPTPRLDSLEIRQHGNENGHTKRRPNLTCQKHTVTRRHESHNTHLFQRCKKSPKAKASSENLEFQKAKAPLIWVLRRPVGCLFPIEYELRSGERRRKSPETGRVGMTR